MTSLQARETVEIAVGPAALRGALLPVDEPLGVVLVAAIGACAHHEAAATKLSEALAAARLTTLTIDLLSDAEEEGDRFSGRLRFDIDFLVGRLEVAASWIRQHPRSANLPIGLLTGGTTSAAALMLAVRRPDLVRAVVSRGGRADLAGEELKRVEAPTLLLVGEQDEPVRDLSLAALAQMRAPAELRVVPGGDAALDSGPALAAVGRLAGDWFAERLTASASFAA